MLKNESREPRMPIPKATEVILTEEEQEGLEQLVRRHNVGQQIALRGRIILAEGQGQTNSAIARQLEISINTAQRGRNRWEVVNEEIMPREQLYDAIEEHLGLLNSGVQVLVARSGIAEGSEAINDVADEILAMTLETVFQIADRYDPSLNVYSWLLAIASNKLKDYKKKIAREYRHADLIGNMPSPQSQDQSKFEHN
jgi:hypothetical protein